MSRRKEKAFLKQVKVNLHLPFMDVEGTWEASIDEQNAAWELYVELITRIATEELKPEEGLLRESLTSLHQIFGETRRILKHYGPAIAQPKGRGDLSFGFIAVAVLNAVIRPVLVYWHPILLDYEQTKPQGISSFEHERTWKRNKELRDTLNKLRETLKVYTTLLAEVAGVPPIEVKRKQ